MWYTVRAMDLIGALQQAVVQSLVDLFEAAILWAPKFVGALVLFVFGLLLAKVARDLTRIFLDKLELDRKLNRFDVRDVLRKVGVDLSVSEVVALGVYWIVLLAFVQSAVGLLGIVFITKFIALILTYIPEIVAALLVFLAGLVIAYYVSRGVKKFTKAPHAPRLAEGIIILLTIVVAVDQLGIDVSLISKLIVAVFTGLIAALAIAFGFGGREKAKELIERYSKKQ